MKFGCGCDGLGTETAARWNEETCEMKKPNQSRDEVEEESRRKVEMRGGI